MGSIGDCFDNSVAENFFATLQTELLDRQDCASRDQLANAVFAFTDASTTPGAAEKALASFPTCPVPEVARLGRTLRAWRAQVLAYFVTHGLSNGVTEAINMLVEKARRLAHGYRNFDN